VSSTPFPTDELEAIAYDFWRAPDVAELDGWRLRFAHGVSGRANSVWPNGPGTLPLDEKIDRAEEWYRARGVPILFQLTEAAKPKGLEDALVARGYGLRGAPVSVQVALLDDVLERTRGEAELLEEPDAAWVTLWTGTRGFTNLDAARAVLMEGDTAFARVVDVAVGRAAAVGEWLGITAMATLPEHRRRGHARAIVHALARWGAGRGCTRAVVQVDSTNEPALAFYAGVGFAQNHRYHYRRLG
jgi:GNAT superfamily N-acetyltransferase